MYLDQTPQADAKTHCMGSPTIAFFKTHIITKFITIRFSELLVNVDSSFC